MPLFSCPHCQTQNFYTRARVRLASKVPLECWKCKKAVRDKKEGKPAKGIRGKKKPAR